MAATIPARAATASAVPVSCRDESPTSRGCPCIVITAHRTSQVEVQPGKEVGRGVRLSAQDPRGKLREIVTKYVSAMRVAGHAPNREVVFGDDGDDGSAAARARLSRRRSRGPERRGGGTSSSTTAMSGAPTTRDGPSPTLYAAETASLAEPERRSRHAPRALPEPTRAWAVAAGWATATGAGARPGPSGRSRTRAGPAAAPRRADRPARADRRAPGPRWPSPRRSGISRGVNYPSRTSLDPATA